MAARRGASWPYVACALCLPHARVLAAGLAARHASTRAQPSPRPLAPEWPRFLVLFRAKYGPARLEELRSAACAASGRALSLAEMDAHAAHGAQGRLLWTTDGNIGPPVLQWIRLPSADVAARAGARCACVRAVLEPWLSGPTLDACAAQAEALEPAELAALHAPLNDGRPWAARFFGYGVAKGGAGLTPAVKRQRLSRVARALSGIPGRVDLKAPEHELWLIEDFEPPTHDPASIGGAYKRDGPRFVALGRLLSAGAAALVHRSRLSARAHKHITSLPADLSVVLANLAQVRPGDAVYDPFCGTGSTLIAAALVAAAAAAPARPRERREAGGDDGGDGDNRPPARLSSVRSYASDVDARTTKLEGNFAQLELDAPVLIERADICALAHAAVAAPTAPARVTHVGNRVERTAGPAGAAVAADEAVAAAREAAELPIDEHARALLARLPPIDCLITDPPYGCMIPGRGGLAGARALANGAAQPAEASAPPSRRRLAHTPMPPAALAESTAFGVSTLGGGSVRAALGPLLAVAERVLAPSGSLVFLLPAPARVGAAGMSLYGAGAGKLARELGLPPTPSSTEVAAGDAHDDGGLRVVAAHRLHFTAENARWVIVMRRRAAGGGGPADV